MLFCLDFTFKNGTLKMSATSDQQGHKVEKSIPGLQMFYRQTREVEKVAKSTIIPSAVS
jgi:hypothetical protein